MTATAAQNTRAAFVQAVAAQLGELDPGAVAQLQGIIDTLGAQRVVALVRCVVRLQALGGCLIVDGTRKRSAGGLFLVLARGCMSQDQRAAVWPEYRKLETAEAPGGQSGASTQSCVRGGEMVSRHTHSDHDSTPPTALQQEVWYHDGPHSCDQPQRTPPNQPGHS
jgi:hypothetical protein